MSATRFEPPSLLRQRKVPRRIDDGSDDHLLLVKKKSASLYYALLDCVTEEIADRFKENDIHWIQLLHLCLLKWDETTSDHISELEIFYRISGLQAEFQAFHAYARKSLTNVKTF